MISTNDEERSKASSEKFAFEKLDRDPELLPTIRKMYQEAGALDTPETSTDKGEHRSHGRQERPENTSQNAMASIEYGKYRQRLKAREQLAFFRYINGLDRKPMGKWQSIAILLAIVLALLWLERIGILPATPEDCYHGPSVDIGGGELVCD